ncbi:MAG: M15 family metallopeptidase [Bacteroidetes bacterium]|nr:M15 family metallopeptidase [Bacteroidota bacterium]
MKKKKWSTNFIEIHILAFSIFVSSCNSSEKSSVDQKKEITNKTKRKVSDQKSDSLVIKVNNLIDIQELNSEILVDLKYASSDNFMKTKLYSRLNRAFLQKDVALRLSNCQDYLSRIKPGYKLLIYDAVRPVSVQQIMWDAMDSLPPIERGKYVSNPKNRSLHNIGAAVDLTICNENKTPLDMGASYDDFREIAYPELESKFLKSGELTKQHIENRELLRKVMLKEGFRNIPTEWWHFNACSRKDGLSKYQVLIEEP